MNTGARSPTQLTSGLHLRIPSPIYGSHQTTGRIYGVQPEAALQLATTQLKKVRDEIGKIIVGQQDVVDGVLICLLAGGHVLLEGVPGLGKTTLLRTLARVLHLKYSRIQFTPDLMPGRHRRQHDHRHRGRREGAALSARPDFRQPGAGRRDQSRHAQDAIALLEAMQEHTVTSGTTTH